MPETYGVMVYQEDVIKVAHHFAGLSLSEADVLRRGMSGKFRSREEFAKIRDKFFLCCKEKGYPETITAEVWRQIRHHPAVAWVLGFTFLMCAANDALEVPAAITNASARRFARSVRTACGLPWSMSNDWT